MRSCWTCLIVTLLAVAPATGQVTKPPVDGITNFAQVETTVACAGATSPQAVAQVRQLGFKSIVNLRTAEEAGADLDGEAAAAKAAGLLYVHLPFNMQAPDPTLVDNFLKTVTAPGSAPVFIHCASGNRASALWMIKRVLVDGWDESRALEEATGLGMTSAAARAFATDYIRSHGKRP